jgi:hypothetical protein
MPLSNRGLAAAASLVLVALVATASCTLSVYNLQALGESNEALLDIKYSIANFGFVPWVLIDAGTARQSWRG